MGIFGRLDWRKSRAHLLLLSKFLNPRTVEDFSQPDDWRAVLREKPQKAIERLLTDGMLIDAGLAGRLAYRFNVTDLKVKLKSKGLPVSGRKEALIERLIKADFKGMEREVQGLRVLQCTEVGDKVAQRYLADEKAEREAFERQVLEYLRQREFKEASSSMAAFEAKRVFPRGMGIDWSNYDTDRDVAILRMIFQDKPKILARLSNEQIDRLRFGAAMMHLWGSSSVNKWMPSDVDTGLSMDDDSAARMVCFSALHRTQMAEYREMGVKSVRILGCNDDVMCEACRKLQGKKLRLNDVPDLPYEKCTSDLGCRCSAVADFDF